MKIKTLCPSCQSLFRLPSELAGKTVRCQKCQLLFTVPHAAGDTVTTATVYHPPIESVTEPVWVPNDEPSSAATPGETPVDSPTSIPETPPTPASPVKVLGFEEPLVGDSSTSKLDTNNRPTEKIDSNDSPTIDRRDGEPRSGRRSRWEDAPRRDRPPTPEKPKASRGVIGTAAIIATFVTFIGCGGSVGGFVAYFANQPRQAFIPQPRPVIKNLRAPGPPIAQPNPGGPVVSIRGQLDENGAYQHASEFAVTDPQRPPMPGFTLGRYKEYTISLKAGRQYIIDLKAPRHVDPFLVVLDRNRNTILWDDDGGRDAESPLNSRIQLTAQYDGDYIIHATTLVPGQFAKYRFILREAGAPIPPEMRPLAELGQLPESVEGKKEMVTREILTSNPGVVATEIALTQNATVGQAVWAPDGKSVVVSGTRGQLSKIQLDGSIETRTLNLGQRCSHLDVSKKGLLLSLIDLNEAWLIDPETLDVKKRITMPRKQRAYTSVGATYALAVPDRLNAEARGVTVLDLEKGQPIFEIPNACLSVAITPNAEHFYVLTDQGDIQKYKFEQSRIRLEKSIQIGTAPNGFCHLRLSPEGSRLAVFMMNGQNQGGALGPKIIRPGETQIAVFDANLVRSPMTLSVAPHFAPSIAFARGNSAAVSVGANDLVRLHQANGQVIFEKLVREPGPFVGTLKDVAIHPHGQQAMFLFDNRVIIVDWQRLSEKKDGLEIP